MGKITITQTDFENMTKQNNDGAKTVAEQEETSKKKKLHETIDVIQKEYDEAPDRTYGDVKIPNVIEKTYVAPTLEQTVQSATEQIAPTYDAKIQTAQTEGDFKKKQKQEEKDEVVERAEESIANLRASAGEATENTSNQALKRGIARSSIVAQLLNDIESAKISAEGGILKERDKSLREIDGKIDEIDASLLNAINELTAEKTYGINEKVQSLLAEYEKKKNEVQEYNNELRQKKAEMITKVKAQGVDVSEENSAEYVKMIADKTKAFYGYYYSLGQDALKELEKDAEYVTEHLGVKGYQSLRGYFS